MAKLTDINIGDTVMILEPLFIGAPHLAYVLNSFYVKEVDLPTHYKGVSMVKAIHFMAAGPVLELQTYFFNENSCEHYKYIFAKNCIKCGPGFFEGLHFFDTESKLT